MAIKDDTVVLLGSSGMLGHDLKQRFQSAKKLYCPTHAELDVTSETDVFRFLSDKRPSLVLNATAYTKVDLAEKEARQCDLLNTKAPAHLANTCFELGAKLVHYSTDQVFEGSGQSAWTEEDPIAPLNTYAATKAEGEKAVLRFDGHLVLRVQWLYGAKKDRFSVLKSTEIFTPFSDQVGAPMWTRDVAEWTQSLIEKKASGLFHLSYDDFASWSEVFEFVKQQWKLKVRLEPKTTASVSLPAKRPLNSRLANRKLRQALGVQGVGSWKTALEEFLKEV